MNPDQPSREQIEARITALLLGELPAAEAELLRWNISQDAELKKLHDQLKLTIGFVSEAMKNPTGAPVERETPLKMSPERRQKVLAHFKTPRPHKLFWLKRIKIPSAYSLAIAAAVILVICGLVAISIPNFVTARSTSQANACINNLRQIDAAKNEWALENGKSKGVVVTENDITPYIQLDSNGNVPKCPGGTYVIGKVGEPAMAELNGKLLTASGNLQDENLAMARGSYSAGEDQSVARNVQQIPAAANRWNLDNGHASRSASDKQLSPFANRFQSVMNQATPPPSANAQKEVTVNFQTTPPARIALPNTESSQTESGQNAGTTVYSQSVVGYVNPPTGASPSSVPNQLDTKTASTPSPLPTISSQLAGPTESQGSMGGEIAGNGNNFDPGVAGAHTGGHALRGPRPTFSGSVGDTTFTAGTVTENSANRLQNGTTVSPTEYTNEVIPLKYANADEIARTLGSVGGAGGGTVSFGSAATSGTTGSHNGFAGAEDQSVSGAVTPNPGTESPPPTLIARANQNANNVFQPGVSAITPTYYVTNGTVHITGYTFKDGGRTNFIAGNQSAFYRMVNSPGGQGGESSEQSPFIARENQNASSIGKTSDVNGPINPATGLPENGPSGSVPVLGQVPIIGRLFTAPATPPQQNQQPIYLGYDDSNEAQAVTAREAQGAKPIIDNEDRLVTVSRIPSLVPTFPPQQPRQQYAENEAVLAQPPEIASAMKARSTEKQADQPSTLAQNNLADNEMIPPGLIDFQGADASQVLEVYAQLTGRTLLRADLPKAQIVLKTDAPLTRTNAIQALQGVLALNGIAVVNVGDKFMKAVPASQAGMAAEQTDKPLSAPIPQPEILTRDNAFSTFSLNVSDVSFKLAAASLEKGQMPAPDSIRSEEFINAFDYRDPEPPQGQPLAFRFERAQDPFAQERDFLRFSIKAAAAGRPEGRALNLVLLLDTSGSMERADRVAIIREALRMLAAQLQPQDTVSVVTFARTARLWADGVPGDQAGATLDKVGSITPEGGTNLEEAMRLAYETARRHFLANGMNRVVLLTDGAANLGNVDPQALTQKVETERRQGIALDCFGIGWEDYNDDLLEQLSSNGDGRYAFINSPDEASTEFAAKLAGALQVAAEDVKVQVEFNPDRVTAWRQIGYAKHQLTKEQFHDNSVAAGAIAAREAGNALYVIETKPDGEGPIATVRVRYRMPGTQDNRERSWLVEYAGAAPALAQSSSAMRLVTTAAETSEWLADSPFAQNVTPDELLNYLSGVPQFYGADERPKQLEWMIRQAKSVSGK